MDEHLIVKFVILYKGRGKGMHIAGLTTFPLYTLLVRAELNGPVILNCRNGSLTAPSSVLEPNTRKTAARAGNVIGCPGCFYLQKIFNGVVLGASPCELDFVPVENQLHLLDVERRLGVIVCLIQRVFSFIIKMQYSE